MVLLRGATADGKAGRSRALFADATEVWFADAPAERALFADAPAERVVFADAPAASVCRVPDPSVVLFAALPDEPEKDRYPDGWQVW